MGVRYDTLARLEVYDRIRDRLDFFRRNQEVLLGKASKEDELKQSSQFQNEDHMLVIGT